MNGKKNTKSDKENGPDIPIFKFYGMWNDLTEQQIHIIEESIKNIRQNIKNRYHTEL